MNTEWSELNKVMQENIKRKATCAKGIEILLLLRKNLMEEIYSFRDELSIEQFSAIPYINAKGYHSKTIAYSLWHIFRIEDIVAHSLISGEEQIFFKDDFQKRINSPIITTGNELVKGHIADFSSQLNIDELYKYITAVYNSCNVLLKKLDYSSLKNSFEDSDKERIAKLNVVSEDDNARWLIDYWCGKNIQGLIKMPFSRHWIMHVEACNRIKAKLFR